MKTASHRTKRPEPERSTGAPGFGLTPKTQRKGRRAYRGYEWILEAVAVDVERDENSEGIEGGGLWQDWRQKRSLFN
jgi:hypothetical protein